MFKNTLKPSPYNNIKGIIIDDLVKKQSDKFVQLLGYSILTFMALDYVALLLHPKFFNPSWELETMGKIIETVYITLLGFMLIFFRPQQQFVKQSELKILSFLSWLALFFGIICFLFAPLIISNSLRISNTNQAIISLQLDNQRQQVEQLTLQQDNLNNEQVRQKLVSQINSAKQPTRQKLQQRLENNKRFLLKMTFKWVLGAIVAGVSFVSIWKYTEWARVIWAYKALE